MSAAGDKAAVEAVRRIAKRYEPDRYLAALLAPAQVRDDSIALAAFAGEIARIPGLVSEPMLGQIRLQWWRDQIMASGPGSARTGNPVADAVAGAIERHRLPPAWFDGIIDAGHAALNCDSPADDADLFARLGASQGNAFALAAKVLGADAQCDQAALCRSAGIAYGLTRLIEGLPRQLARGYMPLPRTRITKYGIDINTMAFGEMSEPVALMLAGLRADARQQLAAARNILAHWHRPGRAAFHPLALVEPYLRMSERGGANPLTDSAALLPLSRVWRILRVHLTGRF